MKYAHCGCSPHQPATSCAVGNTLFAAMTQAWHTLLRSVLHDTKDAWSAWVIAHATYLDHVRGWCEGDLKVQRERGIWMLSTRQQGRWRVRFGSRDERLVVAWLRTHHYQQFVQPDTQRHRIVGYYRRCAA